MPKTSTPHQPQPQSRPTALSRLRRFIFALVYLLPAVLFCSYYPLISLGSDRSMNFELSLPLIWLVLFDAALLLAFILLDHERRRSRPRSRAAARKQSFWGFNFPGLTDRQFFLFSLFPFFATASILWSANPLRALLTAGLIWLVFFAIFALLHLLPALGLPFRFRTKFLTAFFISTTVICALCWLQSFLDLAGLSRDQTLLCLGCTYHSFGFPHPSGLAIEPQFMGNLLLAPTLTALYLLVFHHPRRSSSARTQKDPSFTLSRRQFRLVLAAACLFSATLFLTFSRGAIYAYAVALVALAIFALVRHTFRPSLLLIPIATFLAILGVQGTFAALSPTSETFLTGVTKSIHHLSLGLIDLRPTASDPAHGISDPAENSEAPETTPDSSTDAIFDGYVPESTNVRLSLSSTALRTWAHSPWTIFFGVGLGGAGTAMHLLYPDLVTSPKEIVQNQFISLLLELGLIGVLLLVFAFYLALFSRYGRPRLRSHPALPLLIALLLTYLVTLNFFAGLPNALHIYLLPPLLYLIFAPSASLNSSQPLPARPKTPKILQNPKKS